MKKTKLFYVAFLGLTFSLSAQTIVNTGPGNKHVIIEEFTGIKCGNCPAGHTELDNIINANPPGVVHVVSFNPTNSSYTNPSGTAGTDFRRGFLDAFYTSSYCSSATGSRFMPSAFINRQTASNGDILQSRTLWSGNATSVLAESSPLNVGLKSVYNSTAQTLTIDVEVYYTSTVTAGNSLYVMISEDDLTSDYQSGSSASASNPYVYKHTFRENVSTGQWGDAITGATTQGSLYTTQYVFNLSGATDPINIAKAHVLAYVVENNATKEVYTGISVDADGGQGSTGTGTVGVNELSNNVNFNISPNPTKGNVNIIVGELNSSSQLDVINVLGEVVYSEKLIASSNQTINLHADVFTSKGIYFVRITNSETSITKKLITK